MPFHLPSRQPTTSRLAFIVDVPDSPTTVLSHSARHTLSTTLATVGLSLDEALLASVWPTPAVLVGKLDWHAAAVQRSIMDLLAALRTFRPNLVVLLGNDPKSPSHAALHLFKSGNVAPPTTKAGKVKWEWATGTWRGSLFLSSDLLWQPLDAIPATDVHPVAASSAASPRRASDAGAAGLNQCLANNTAGVDSPTCPPPSAPVLALDLPTTAAPPAPTECIYPQQRLLTAAKGDAGTGFSAGDAFAVANNDGNPLATLPSNAAATPHAPGPLRVPGSNVQPTALSTTATVTAVNTPLGSTGVQADTGDDAGSLFLAAAPSGGSCSTDSQRSAAATTADNATCASTTMAAESVGRRFADNPDVLVSRASEIHVPTSGDQTTATGISGDGTCRNGLSYEPTQLVSNAPGCLRPFKCIATWHPSFVNRAWSHYLTELRCDVRRMRDEAATATLALDDCLIEFGPAAV